MGENARAWKRDNDTVYMAANETGLLVTLRSTDRGITWGQVYENRDFFQYQVRVLGGIPNTDTLILVGYDGQEVAIFRSEDGGAVWNKVWSMNSVGCEYMPFLYTSAGRIITIVKTGGTYYVLTSDDGGKTFVVRYTNNFYGNNLGIFSLVEGDNGRIFGPVMDASSNSLRILKSDDSGKSWSIISPPSSTFSYTGSFMGNALRLADGTIVILGTNTNTSNPTLLNYSRNNGISWSVRSLSNYRIYRAIAVQNSIIFQNNDDKKIYRIDNIESGNPMVVGTATFEINDFLGFE